jgi:hypothetical protein
MKLISMTDFVLDLNNDLSPTTSKNKLIKIVNYASFLKQPLKLEMFILCDDDGNVMEEPVYNGVDEQYYEAQREQYQKEKAKVLFKGFQYFGLNSFKKGNYLIDFDNIENSNIESLLRHEIEFELTDSAIKRIS